MGIQIAKDTFALVFGNHSAGEVAPPGGYLGAWLREPGQGNRISIAASMLGSVDKRRDVLIIEWNWHILPIEET